MGTEPVPTVGGLSERALSVALFLKYAALAVYGLWSIVAEIPTFVIVGSPLFALVWASAVCTLAVLAAAGVARSWTTSRHRMERWTTAAFVLTFVGYSFALVYRAIETSAWEGSALAVIPVAVCILPAIRYYSLVRRTRRTQPKGPRG